jgi:hypothetical protein
MTLYVPARYKCRQHDRDLTDEVQGRVEAAAEVVASVGHRVSFAPAPRPFRVLVHCPGADGQDDGHELAFQGTRHP